MSDRFFDDDVLFFQRFLSCCGLYTRKLDGVYGRFTAEAEAKFDAQCDLIAASEGRLDDRTERNLRSLQLVAQTLARRSVVAIRASGRNVKIISGTRSYDEQNTLFRKGRFGNPGPRVTNARGGQSWHNFGLAWDIGLFDATGGYITDSAAYRAVSPAGKVAGLEWGGDWKSFPDAPHYQVGAAGRTISQARSVFEAGGR